MVIRCRYCNKVIKDFTRERHICMKENPVKWKYRSPRNGEAQKLHKRFLRFLGMSIRGKAIIK